MMRSNVTNPQTVYKEQRRKYVEGARAAGGKKGGAGLVLQDVVRARPHARTHLILLRDPPMLDGCGTERASLLMTSAPVPRSLLNKKEERRSKQSRANLSIFSFPPNYIVLYCIVL